MHLVTNLPSPACILIRSPSPVQSTPPLQSLAIIPPKTSAIKIAIAKSMSVINQSKKVKCNDKLSKPNNNIAIPNDSQLTLTPATAAPTQKNIPPKTTAEYLASFSLPDLLDEPSTSIVNINAVEVENKPESTDLVASSTATPEAAILDEILNENIEADLTPNVLDDSLFQQPLMLDCDPNILEDLPDSIINDNNSGLLESVDNLLSCEDFLAIDNLVNNLDENILNQCEEVNVDANFFMADNLLIENNMIDPPAENSKESLDKGIDCDGMNNLLIPPMGPLKRTRNNQEQATNYFKKKASSAEPVLFPENIDVLENILPVNNPVPDDKAFQPMNNLVNPPERFDTYIHELTDPNSGIFYKEIY